MNSLPVLYLFLLLPGLQVPQALGMPTAYSGNIMEIIVTLEERTPSPLQFPQKSLNTTEKSTLRHKGLLRPNLDVFLKAAENYSETGGKLKKNLQVFWSHLPIPTSTENPIVIEDNWDDFKSKLTYYLDYLLSFLKNSTSNKEP